MLDNSCCRKILCNEYSTNASLSQLIAHPYVIKWNMKIEKKPQDIVVDLVKKNKFISMIIQMIQTVS